MTKKSKMWTLALLALIITGLVAYGVFYYFNPVKQPSSLPTDIKVTDTNLLSIFEVSSGKAQIDYKDKIIEVTGDIKKTEIQENANNVIFDRGGTVIAVAGFTDEEKIKVMKLLPGQKIILKGIYKGYIEGDTAFGTPSEIKIDQCTIVE